MSPSSRNRKVGQQRKELVPSRAPLHTTVRTIALAPAATRNDQPTKPSVDESLGSETAAHVPLVPHETVSEPPISDAGLDAAANVEPLSGLSAEREVSTDAVAPLISARLGGAPAGEPGIVADANHDPSGEAGIETSVSTRVAPGMEASSSESADAYKREPEPEVDGHHGAHRVDHEVDEEPVSSTETEGRDDDSAVAILPQADGIESRLAEIRQILVDHASITAFVQAELIAEWVTKWEEKVGISGQAVRKFRRRGRPEGGIAQAARELPVPGDTDEARRQVIRRAIKIAAIKPDAKLAAKAAGLDKKPTALSQIAKGKTLEAQLLKVRELAERTPKPRRGRDQAGARERESAMTAEIETLKEELARKSERLLALEKDIDELWPVALPEEPNNSEIRADVRLSPDNESILAGLLTKWGEHLQADFISAPVTVRKRFMAEVQRRAADLNTVSMPQAAE
jgi:hypothetical protein